MRSEKAYTRIKAAASAWAAICAVYFLWEALSYRGFFGRLAELQIGKFGAYAPFLTYLFLFGVAIVPALFIVWILRPSGRDVAGDASLVELRISQARRLRLIIALLGIISVATSAAFLAYSIFVLPGQEGSLRTLAISDIGAVAVNEGPTRLVGGELGTIVYFGHNWYVGDERMAFAPYRPPSGSDGLAYVFVELDARNREALAATEQRPVWSGILVEGGLPGAARVLFNSIGVGVAEPHYTLYRDEYALKIGYWLQAVQWLILSGFLFILTYFLSRRVRRREEALLTTGS